MPDGSLALNDGIDQLVDAKRSFRGRLWRLPRVDRQAIAAMLSENVPGAIAPILAARGMAPEEAKAYLEPTLRELLPNPAFFNGMNDAIERVVKAVEGSEKVAIWGDYDVDGATSSAVLARYLRLVGIEPLIHIPDRIVEGYGPNAPGLLRLKNEEGISLVCVLDSGTVARDPIGAATDAGLDVVVIDHHAAEAELPRAVAIVNPNRLDQEPGYGHLCAAGMTFIFCVGLNAALRDRGILARIGVKPDLMKLLDIVALGTVADIVSLSGINRAFVRRGLEMMARRGNPGLEALFKVSGLVGAPGAYHCGYVLGPRINAGGRVGFSGTGAALLSSDDPIGCQVLARQLDEWNKERQQIERACVVEARAQVEAGVPRASVFAVGEEWHEGVVGIVAARLMQAYDKPAFVFSHIGDGLVKGSARSVKGFDLGQAVMRARREGVLGPVDDKRIKAGGHGMAAGLTLLAERLGDLQDFIDGLIAGSDFARTGVITEIDMVLPVERACVPLADALGLMEPFGQGNPRPRFLFPAARIASADLLKEAHLRCILEAENGIQVKAMAFNIGGTPLADTILASVGREIDIVGSIEINEWNGRRTAEIRIEDARDV